MVGLTFSSYKLYDSSRFQAFMMADFNTGKYNTPYEIYGEKLDDNSAKADELSTKIDDIEGKSEEEDINEDLGTDNVDDFNIDNPAEDAEVGMNLPQ